MADTTPRCVATTKDGRPCVAPPIRGHSECFHHDSRPGAQEKVSAARNKGGKARLIQMKRLMGQLDPDLQKAVGEMVLETPDDAKEILGFVAKAVMMGTIEPRAANAMVMAIAQWNNVHRDWTMSQQLADARTMIEEIQKRVEKRQADELEDAQATVRGGLDN